MKINYLQNYLQMKYKQIKILLIVLLIVTTISCNVTNNAILYKNAVIDAAFPDSSKICNSLIAITLDNKDLVWKTINGEKYILVNTWKSAKDTVYYKNNKSGFYNTGKYPIWVTVVPELTNKIGQSNFFNKTDTILRIKQLLGLPMNANKQIFVEFWVRPQDLFRPSRDKEISDNKADLCFPNAKDSTHQSWINKTVIDSYYSCNQKYPWTQLGYTYDWNAANKKHIGLSEFIIDANKNVIINRFIETKKYLSEKPK